MALSKARVLYILKKLEGKGIDAARMTWAYHGETMPAYSNTEEITRRNNRRVDIKLNEVIDNQEEISETIEYELWKEECK
jgi:outer membrane protein OmpA-like peptidoglycan-associated protein